MNTQLHQRLHYGTLWASVLVLDGIRRARDQHRDFRDDLRRDDRGVVSIEYVLIAAAAAAIAIVLGGLIVAKVRTAAEGIETNVEIE